MIDYELYYGLPQVIWDDLYDDIEDLLQEEHLGNHIVGIYPAGNRIYGFESAPPGLMCLYVDSVEPMIDPISNYNNRTGFKVFHIKNGNSPIVMVDFFKWISWMFGPSYDGRYETYWRYYALLHAIPFGNHVAYEEESISDIMEACYAGLKETGFLQQAQNMFTACNEDNYLAAKKKHNDLVPPRYLYARAVHVLQTQLSLQPNINKDWDTVIDNIVFNDPLYKKWPRFHVDKNMIKNIIKFNGNILPENDRYFAEKLNPNKTSLNTIYNLRPTKETLERIRTETMNFYRFQL